MTTIGLIGSGHIGSTVARLAVRPATTSCSATGGARRRSPTWSPSSARTPGRPPPAEAAAAGDLVVVTIPLKSLPRRCRSQPLRGKVVIDTNNYYPQRDGQIAELDDESTTVSELLQAHLPGVARGEGVQQHLLRAPRSRSPRPAGSPDRSALPIAGDDDGRQEDASPASSTTSATTPSTSVRWPRAGASSATPPRTALRTTSRAGDRPPG